MKIVYIAHPIGGDVRGNLKKIADIVRAINLGFETGDVIPFVPYYCDCVALDDGNPIHRDRGIYNDTVLIERMAIAGVLSELWVYGNIISSGVKAEIELAERFNIPVIYKNK